MEGRVMTRKSEPLDFEVGRKVRALRLNKNMSQQRLAEALGLTFQQVQKYETGTNRISASRLQRIAKSLDVQTSVFFPDTKHSPRGGTSTLFDLVDWAAALRHCVPICASRVRGSSGSSSTWLKNWPQRIIADSRAR